MNQEIIHAKKKKWYKRKWFYIIVVIILLIVAGLVKAKMGGQEAEYQTVKVEQGALKQTVDATGNVKSADELDLRFEASGRVARIYKNINQSVKPGEIIAELELGELNAKVAQSSASVAKAQANLDKEMAGNTAEYIANLQAKVDKAEADLEQIKASHADAVSDAEADLRTAENNLELSEGGENSQIVQDAYDDMIALLQAVQNTLADTLNEADNILGIDNTLANDEFQDYLSIFDVNKLNIANNKYAAARAAKLDTDTAVNSLTAASVHEEIDWASDTAEEALTTAKNLLFAVSAVLNNTPPIGDLSQTELSTMKTNIQTARTSVATKYTSLVNQMQAVTTAKNSYQTNKIAYDKALANLENTKKKEEADINAYQALVDQAQANLNDAKNPPREVDLASYRAALQEAQANLAQAMANKNKARIIAPVAGTIGKIDIKAGEYVSTQDTAIKLISPHFEVKVDIPETDIVKIALGDEAIITLDAFGDEVEFSGVVAEIEKGETVIQDVVYYNVTLTLKNDEENELLNGLTANVIFYTEEKENVLFIPQRAVYSVDGSKKVRLLEDGEVKEILVETGLRGDNGLIEIIQGLKEGQEVVVKEIK